MIEFKFRGELEFRELPFNAHKLTAQMIKAAICEQVHLCIQMDIVLENEQGELIPSNKTWTGLEKISLVCRRIPKARDPTVTTASLAVDAAKKDIHHTKEEAAIDKLCQRHDLNSLMEKNGTAQVSGPVLRYSKSYRHAVRQHERMEKQPRMESDGKASGKGTGDSAASTNNGGEEKRDERPVPPEYVCNRCGHNDHWVWNCPTNDDPDHVRKVRTAKGIPRFYLTKVKDVDEAQARSLGGVTLVIPGNNTHYIWTHNPDKQEHKDRVGDTIQEKVVTAFSDGAKHVEDSLKCPLCRRLFRKAVLAPCCGASFCSDCAIERLCHNGITGSRCPHCSKELMAHQLVPNQDLQNQVDAVIKASSGKKNLEEQVDIPTIRLTSHRGDEGRKKLNRPIPIPAPAMLSPPHPATASLPPPHRPNTPGTSAPPPPHPSHSVDSYAELLQLTAPKPAQPSTGPPPQVPPPISVPPSQSLPPLSAAPLPQSPPSPALPSSPPPTVPRSPKTCLIVNVSPDSDYEHSPLSPVLIESPPQKKMASRDEPLSRQEFKSLKKAWSEYNDKLARKQARQENRERRHEEREKKRRRT
eukprot:GEMP01017214.1.p1 GENE.GEMP01017214.1~~GEMP01017214.1.p1  ORF type:complete len:601 (+),score=131.91 GEMP01017214.1:57-1805(+)